MGDPNIRETVVDWRDENYGAVNFGGNDSLNPDDSNPLLVAGAGTQTVQQPQDLTEIMRRLSDHERRIEILEEELRKLKKGVGSIKVFDKLLEQNTDTGDVDTWIDLPGLSRGFYTRSPSTVLVIVQLNVSCAAVGSVPAARYASRVLVNDVEAASSRGEWSEVGSHLMIPQMGGDSETRTLIYTAIFDTHARKSYRFKVQHASLGAALLFTANAPSDSRMTILNLPRRDREPAVPGTSYTVPIAATYDEFHGRVVALQRRKEWDRPIVGYASTGWARLYYEVVAWEVDNFPTTDFNANYFGHLIYRWEITESPADTADETAAPWKGRIGVRGEDGRIFVEYAGGPFTTPADYPTNPKQPQKMERKLISPAGYVIKEASVALTTGGTGDTIGVYTGGFQPIFTGNRIYTPFEYTSATDRDYNFVFHGLDEDTLALEQIGTWTGSGADKPKWLGWGPHGTTDLQLIGGTGDARLWVVVFTTATGTFGIKRETASGYDLVNIRPASVCCPFSESGFVVTRIAAGDISIASLNLDSDLWLTTFVTEGSTAANMSLLSDAALNVYGMQYAHPSYAGQLGDSPNAIDRLDGY